MVTRLTYTFSYMAKVVLIGQCFYSYVFTFLLPTRVSYLLEYDKDLQQILCN